MLVVCPTNHLRTQWSDAAGKIGLQLDPDLTNEQAAEARTIMERWSPISKSVWLRRASSGSARARRRCSSSMSCIMPATARTGAKPCVSAFEPAVFRLILSGTPFRSDNNPIPFIRYEQGESRADFAYGYTEAIRDSVCRPIVFPSYEGELTWLSEGREHRATFEDGLTFNRQRERLKTALLQDTWLGPVMTDAHAQLTRIRKQEQPMQEGSSSAWIRTMPVGLRNSSGVLPAPKPPLRYRMIQPPLAQSRNSPDTRNSSGWWRSTWSAKAWIFPDSVSVSTART